MEKLEAYRPNEETIEAWLEKFEIRLQCHGITAIDKKKHWCQALIGEAGRSIIKGVVPGASWAAIKQELLDVLGESNPQDRAFDRLINYKPGQKGLGEIATDILVKASKATDDADMRLKLGLKAFLKAVPESIGRDLRRKHFRSVREALEEARFLQRVQEEEEAVKDQVLAASVEQAKGQIDQSQTLPYVKDELVDAIVTRLGKQGLVGDRGGSVSKGKGNRGKIVCWCCGESGHVLMQCPIVKKNRSEQRTRPNADMVPLESSEN